MAVQTTQKDGDTVEVIAVPEVLPNEIVENDSLLALESNVNKLEDKLLITARGVLNMSKELKTQIHEIGRLEEAIIDQHEFMVEQNERIIHLIGLGAK